MRFNFTSHSAAVTSTAPAMTTSGYNKEKSAQPLKRPSTIEEDPDSLDSVISNPQSYPITIVPNRPASFYGLATNGKSFQRQPSCRRLSGRVNRGLSVRAALIPKPNTGNLGIDNVGLRSQSVSVEFSA
ncbi:hypothetical protein ACLKA7_011446 [Drosophila subpalustris]